MFRCPAALSASIAKVLKNSISFLALFRTSLLSRQYFEVRLLFLTFTLHVLISTFQHFLCVIRFHVSAESHSFFSFCPGLHRKTLSRSVSVLSNDCLGPPPHIQGLSACSLLSS